MPESLESAKFEGKPVVLSRAANEELFRYGCNSYDVVRILEDGYDCSRSRRSSEVIERCIDLKDRTLKAVVASSVQTSSGLEVWVLVHFGVFSRRR